MRGINRMKLFWRAPGGDSRAYQRATSKATMSSEINRNIKYVPIPKKMRCTPYQGFEELKVTSHGWERVSDHVWNQQDGAISADKMPRFSAGPAGYEQSHDVS